MEPAQQAEEYQIMIRQSDGSMRGPFTVAEVKQFWLDGQVSGKTLVEVNGGDSIYLHEIRSTIMGQSPAVVPLVPLSDHPMAPIGKLLTPPKAPIVAPDVGWPASFLVIVGFCMLVGAVGFALLAVPFGLVALLIGFGLALLGILFVIAGRLWQILTQVSRR